MAINAHDWITEKLDKFDMMQLVECETMDDVAMLAHNSFLLNGIINSCFEAQIFPEVVETKEELREILDKIMVLAEELNTYFSVYYKHQQEAANEQE